MRAILMIDVRHQYKTIEIPNFVEYIRVRLDHPLSSTKIHDSRFVLDNVSASSFDYSDSSSTTATVSGNFVTIDRNRMPHLIFKFYREISPPPYAKYEPTLFYMLDGLEEFNERRFKVDDDRVFNDDFDPPTEKVNLNRLSEKLKDNLQTKELLLKYYKK